MWPLSDADKLLGTAGENWITGVDQDWATAVKPDIILLEVLSLSERIHPKPGSPGKGRVNQH